MICPKCKHDSGETYDYCPGCVTKKLEVTGLIIQKFLDDNDFSLKTDGPNVKLRAKTGEEVYL